MSGVMSSCLALCLHVQCHVQCHVPYVVFLLTLMYITLLFSDTRANINTLAVTSSGSIQGHVIQSHTGGAVVEYLGIPYALPPVGDRRYADPETYQKLPGELIIHLY